MFTPPRPTVQIPESFQCTSHATLASPARLVSPTEVTAIVTSAVEHLGQRLTGTRFTISPSIAVGTTRSVFTVSALDQNESFVVKVTTKDTLRHDAVTPQRPLPTFRSEWVKRHLALEEQIPLAGCGRVTVAPPILWYTLTAIKLSSNPPKTRSFWRIFGSANS